MHPGWGTDAQPEGEDQGCQAKKVKSHHEQSIGMTTPWSKVFRQKKLPEAEATGGL
jgi:hypothetical protein